MARLCAVAHGGFIMKNAVGRDIPDSLLVNGREGYQGRNYMDGKYIQKASPKPAAMNAPRSPKLRRRWRTP